MFDIAHLLQQGSTNLWVFIPSALVLGALHGLEPGHSKTMMAAFIVAIRGTVWQAVLLGLSATLSHTSIVWIVALAGLHFGRSLNVEASEPYFQIASAAIILMVAGWMLWRTLREQREADHEQHDHVHSQDEGHVIDTGHGLVALSIFEAGVPPRFRVESKQGATFNASEVRLTTTRPDGDRTTFAFANRGTYLESVEEIPEPHQFAVRLTLSHGTHAHGFDVAFHEHGEHHDHDDLNLGLAGYQDAHERAHAEGIRRRFASRHVTTGQIIAFGLTGGLIPCPAAITVLLLCLQLKQVALGGLLVLCFSVGLAATMVTVGIVAALSMRQAERKWSGAFSYLARRAPYASTALISIVGLALMYQGWSSIR